MDIARFSLRHGKAIVFIVIVFAALGVRSYMVAPASIFPNMTFSRIDVVAEAGELPPDQVRIAIARPLEQAFQTLPSVISVRSAATQGSAELIVEFDPKTDPQADLGYVNQAISRVRASLPSGADVVAVTVNPNSEPVLSFALTSGVLSPTLLEELVTKSIRPALAGIPGLGRIVSSGANQREYHVMLDPGALAARGLTAKDVADALSAANRVEAVGVTERFYQRSIVLVDAGLRDARSLGRVSVPLRGGGAVPISALGSVELGIAPATAAAGLDGKPAVSVSFYALPGADAVKMADAVKRRMDAFAGSLPRGVSLALYWDQTRLIVESQTTLRDAILLGAVLAIIVIFLFLRNLRITLIAAAIIPLAMAIALFALQSAGQTLNLMSVGGLAVAVGLIIDDAIVVIESIARNVRERGGGIPSAETIRESVAQIAPAMAASTATTVVVFLPLALLSGVSGFFFRALAFTLSTSLIVSLGIAIFVTPTMAIALLGSSTAHGEERGIIPRLLAKYEPILRSALANRAPVFWAACLVLIVTVGMLSVLPNDFLPKMDEGQFEIQYKLPVGTTLAASDAAARAMERVVKADPAVETVGRLTGVDSNGFSPMPQNRGLLHIRLVPENQRAQFDTIAERMRTQLEAAVPSAQFSFRQILEDMIDDLSGAPAPVEVTVASADRVALLKTADHITTALSTVPGVVDPFNGVNYDDPTVRVAPDVARLAAFGVTAPDVASALLASRQGIVATTLPGSLDLVPVRVAVMGTSSAAVADVPVFGAAGTAAVGDLGQIRPGPLSSDIDEYNGQQIDRVTSGIENADLSAVVAGINRVLRDLAIPPGVRVTIGGQYQAQSATFKEFVEVIAIAVILVFTVMLAVFGSFRLPLVILTAIPLALFGVAFGLFVTRTPFNVSSFMGLLLLVGIVVKNGILLIDVANKRRTAGDSVEKALVIAGRTRLRPIVMTTLAAIGGLLPLAIGMGSGAAMERPLAIAVIGGLSTATAFTLVLIPVLYAAFIRDGDMAGREETAA
jgi:CzcA family heavy metal efflux pump